MDISDFFGGATVVGEDKNELTSLKAEDELDTAKLKEGLKRDNEDWETELDNSDGLVWTEIRLLAGYLNVARVE